MTVALAIFVKTPGFSPLKTRLATGIGEAAARAFFERAAACVAATAAATPGLAPYWAVAEPAALAAPCWAGLPRVAQGEGDLGQRLDLVYRTLRARHAAVLLVGADSPQLTPADLGLAAAAAIRGFALGPTPDGGFWVFGGAAAIPRARWLAVPYSAADTASRLIAELAPLGPVATLPERLDVDRLEDLAALEAALGALEAPSPAQAELLAWLGAKPW